MCINCFAVGIPCASSFLSVTEGPTAGGLELDSLHVCCWGVEVAVIPTAVTLGTWVQGVASAPLAGVLVDVAWFWGSTIRVSTFVSPSTTDILKMSATAVFVDACVGNRLVTGSASWGTELPPATFETEGG